ncbi:hypothetical protein FHW83_003733 [Duganella sp. SG902]|uniref:hypothetical protein n=1 Tax=Duganella sp. SG902 TaxID=2587016 RepID=UPI00159D5097|nr:hypothetical protein [Duganella sp. SG902]NVM77910.1 hypothetical protein [Duganella sp. SG902]
MQTDDTRDPRLDASLEALRGALADRHTPSSVEDTLMKAYARQYPKRRWYQRISLPQWGLAGGLASAALAATVFLLSPPSVPQAQAMAQGSGAFIALEPLERIRREPEPRIVETIIARTALAGLGVPITPETAGDQVRAEMLIGADGQPLALRLSRL